MKYKLLYIIMQMCIGCVCLCGCSTDISIEQSKIITACHAANKGDITVYTFYVSAPQSGKDTENGDQTSQAEIYSFEATDFSEALDKFSQSVSENMEIRHLTLFVADPSYMDLTYSSDYEFIRNSLGSTPFMYYLVTSDTSDSVFECINTLNSGNVGDFTDLLFGGSNSYLACTATELQLGVENKYYTVALPVVEFREDKSTLLPEFAGAYVYSDVCGTFFITGDDYEIFRICRKKLYYSEKLYDIEILPGEVNVIICCNTENKMKIAELGNRYATCGFDILNCVFFMKNRFLTYSSYENYVGKLYSQSINFLCRE